MINGISTFYDEDVKMKENMKILELIVSETIGDFCAEKGIEYVFAASSKDGLHSIIANNELSNVILKKAFKVIKTIVKM